MTKVIQRNITALEAVYDNHKRRFNKATKEKVRNIIDLYSERKIAQFTTADNLIRKFITAKTTKDKEKAETEAQSRRKNGGNKKGKCKNRKNKP